MLKLERHWDNGLCAVDMNILATGYDIILSTMNDKTIVKNYMTKNDDIAVGIFETMVSIFNYRSQEDLLKFKIADNFPKHELELITIVKE